MRQPGWGALLGEMIIRRGCLTQLNPELWQPSIPGARATDDDLRAAEVGLGRPLDAQHRELLLEGDGWQDGFGWGDLLRADQIGTGETWTRTLEFLDNLYAAPGDDLPHRSGLCPVLVGDEDVVAIDLDGPLTEGGHPVYRFDPAGVVDQWPNMRQYWLAQLTTLNRLIEREVSRTVRARTATREARPGSAAWAASREALLCRD
ncbi:SMI1/KNR4 family protein [Cellulomonas xiejunii]|uniref:SMI1/KNR4 family protein n=1 Tax=Cellulomonas xiejunii TaxID=2968083 RepID=A0ABY5KQ69_9CELL|nr:SMI1/KNR4 family protein [Cellulomonas xiejunii]MCC2322613.1 SMI1/KNR4 family protein [Cellulomonas xiejunii]UUI72646.1 SMI1/KNR4 family protein [Cellulomonas xiejunii]